MYSCLLGQRQPFNSYYDIKVTFEIYYFVFVRHILYYAVSVRPMLNPKMLRNMILMARKNGLGGQIKTVGYCSIDVLDSKYAFGMSAPPGEKMG